MSRLFFLALHAFVSLSLVATEVDNFTDRDPALEDSRVFLNLFMNSYMQLAAQRATKKDSCEKSIIEAALKKELGGVIGWLLWSTLEQDIESHSYVDKRRSKKSESIYEHVSFCEGVCLHLAKFGFTLKIDQYTIGTDKLGHFLHLGGTYFNKANEEGGSLEDALAWGEYTERTYFGLQTTGIYSYGDLVANYEGMHFWERVTGANLPKDKEAYFQCEDGVWNQTAEFDWLDYVNHAWDEGINCNRYKSKEMSEKIQLQIEKLEASRNTRMSCPIKPQECENMKTHYGDIAHRLISEKCYE